MLLHLQKIFPLLLTLQQKHIRIHELLLSPSVLSVCVFQVRNPILSAQWCLHMDSTVPDAQGMPWF